MKEGKERREDKGDETKEKTRKETEGEIHQHKRREEAIMKEDERKTKGR